MPLHLFINAPRLSGMFKIVKEPQVNLSKAHCRVF